MSAPSDDLVAFSIVVDEYSDRSAFDSNCRHCGRAVKAFE